MKWFREQSRVRKLIVLVGLLITLTCLCSRFTALIEEPLPELSPDVRQTAEALATGPTSTPAPTRPPIPTDTPAPMPSPVPPTATPEPRAAVEALVKKTLGRSNRDVDRVGLVTLSADNWVTVEWAINDNLTSGMIKGSTTMDIAHVARALCEASFCAGLTMRGSFSMVDVYGNVSEDVVVQIVLQPETLTKINWATFDHRANLYTVADTVKLHPAFQD